jgi:hypothetical protein
MGALLKLLKNSRVVGVVAQVGVLLGAIDLGQVASVLPPKVAGVVTAVAGVVSWYNRAFGTSDPASDGSFFGDTGEN